MINTEIMYTSCNTLKKNFLCCKTFAAKVLKYSEIRSYKIKPKQVYLGGFGFTVAFKDLSTLQRFFFLFEMEFLKSKFFCLILSIFWGSRFLDCLNLDYLHVICIHHFEIWTDRLPNEASEIIDEFIQYWVHNTWFNQKFSFFGFPKCFKSLEILLLNFSFTKMILVSRY